MAIRAAELQLLFAERAEPVVFLGWFPTGESWDAWDMYRTLPSGNLT